MGKFFKLIYLNRRWDLKILFTFYMRVDLGVIPMEVPKTWNLIIRSLVSYQELPFWGSSDPSARIQSAYSKVHRQGCIVSNNYLIIMIIIIAVPADNRVKLKESEKRDKYVDLA